MHYNSCLVLNKKKIFKKDSDISISQLYAPCKHMESILLSLATNTDANKKLQAFQKSKYGTSDTYPESLMTTLSEDPNAAIMVVAPTIGQANIYMSITNLGGTRHHPAIPVHFDSFSTLSKRDLETHTAEGFLNAEETQKVLMYMVTQGNAFI